jgi:hypothetical protein
MAQRLVDLQLTDSPSVESLERAYSALSIEAEMNACTDPYKLENLRERYRQEVQGIYNSRGNASR